MSSQPENGSGDLVECLNSNTSIELSKAHMELLIKTTEDTLQCGCHFQWKIPMEFIKRFQSFCKDIPLSKTPTTSGYLHSPTFTSLSEKSNTRADWSIGATMFRDEKGIEYLSLYLRMLKFHGESNDQNKFAFAICICDKDFKHVQYRKCSKIFAFGTSPDNDCYGWRHYIPLRALGKSQDTLNIQATIIKFERIEPAISLPEAGDESTTAEESSDSEMSEQSEGISTPLSPSSIHDRMKAFIADLWRNKRGWDLIINCKDASFAAHKSILMARSTYFAELFKYKLQFQIVNGFKKTVYPMYDVKSSLVEGMLEFSYTGNTTLFESLVDSAKLCSLASELKMKALAKESFLALSQPSRLKPWTIIMILQHAKYVLDQPSCFVPLEKFIRENFETLRDMGGFIEWMRSDVNVFIMRCILRSPESTD